MELIRERIVVVGVSASGKTQFAERLAAKHDLPLTKMDAIMWQPGWHYIGDEETVRRIHDKSAEKEWVIEGYIATAARADLFSRATQIVWLDYPGWLCAWRYLKRWWQHRHTPRPEMPGSPERFSFSFLKLVFTKGEVRGLQGLLNAKDNSRKLVRLNTPKSAQQFLNSQ